MRLQSSSRSVQKPEKTQRTFTVNVEYDAFLISFYTCVILPKPIIVCLLCKLFSLRKYSLGGYAKTYIYASLLKIIKFSERDKFTKQYRINVKKIS